MTFCIGIRVDEGVVALADTRIVRGSEKAVKSKLSTIDVGGHTAVVMTSGLRSVRDKVVHRLTADVSHSPCRRMYQLATAFGHRLREVEEEDGESLKRSGLSFDSHAIIGGQLADDEHPSMFHVYPEGNWVEVTADEPSIVIGRSSHGKPILDRLLSSSSSVRDAVAVALLAFDATRTSATDVDFPIEIAVFDRSAWGRGFSLRRFEEVDVVETLDEWHRRLRVALTDLPAGWMNQLNLPYDTEIRPSP